MTSSKFTREKIGRVQTQHSCLDLHLKYAFPPLPLYHTPVSLSNSTTIIANSILDLLLLDPVGDHTSQAP